MGRLAIPSIDGPDRWSRVARVIRGHHFRLVFTALSDTRTMLAGFSNILLADTWELLTR